MARDGQRGHEIDIWQQHAAATTVLQIVNKTGDSYRLLVSAAASEGSNDGHVFIASSSSELKSVYEQLITRSSRR